MAVQNDTGKKSGNGDMLLPLEQEESSSDEFKNESQSSKRKQKMKFKHFFSKSDLHPFEEIKWERREALIWRALREDAAEGDTAGDTAGY